MLKTDKPIYKVLLVLNLLLIVLGVVTSVRLFFSSSEWLLIAYRAINIVALVFALFYILYGYTKNAAGYYKTYGYLLFLSILITSITAFQRTTKNLTIISCAALIIVSAILAFGKDLGKKNSFILCGVLVLGELVNSYAVYNLYGLQKTFETCAINLVIVCLYGIMTYAKYLDKAERGTK